MGARLETHQDGRADVSGQIKSPPKKPLLQARPAIKNRNKLKSVSNIPILATNSPVSLAILDRLFCKPLISPLNEKRRWQSQGSTQELVNPTQASCKRETHFTKLALPSGATLPPPIDRR
jgi:hypothetical protein